MTTCCSVLLAAAVLFSATAATAATYYVDYADGNDGNSGVAPGQAFKHAPGDSRAAGAARALRLQPGDTVIFKGGVVYRGSIAMPAAGAPGKPITYDGNTAGTFGEGRAIIDGSERLTGWRRCTGPQDAAGNPNWRNIFVAELPENIDPYLVNLFEDDRMGWVAQEPNPRDPFFLDDLGSYRRVPRQNVTVTTLVDPARLNQKELDAWAGALMLIWGTPNRVYLQNITAFDPASGKLTFDAVPGVYTNRDTAYSLANHLRILDIPGEFVVVGRRVYYWPQTAGDLAEKTITYSSRRVGVDFAARSNVTLQGFIVQKQGGRERAVGLANTGGRAAGIVIRDNEIRRVRSRERSSTLSLAGLDGGLIDGNRIYENARCRGMAFNDAVDLVVSNNILHKNGSTGIAFFTCKRSKMLHNTVTAHTGVHANALTVYLNSADILVFGNRVYDSNIALTTQKSRNITVACNILTGRGGYIVADWDGCDGLSFYNNVILAEQGEAAITVGLDSTNIVFKNNICAGQVLARITQGAPVLANNLYTRLSNLQRPDSLEPGALLVNDLNRIFVDPAKRDYRLKPGSPAIDAGVDVGLETDITGVKIPQGKAPDVGAHEWAR